MARHFQFNGFGTRLVPLILRQPGRWAAFLLPAGLAGCTSLKPAQLPPQPLAAGELARLDGDYWNTSSPPSYHLAEQLLTGKFRDRMLPDSVGYGNPQLHLTIRAVSQQAVRVQVFYRARLLTEAVRQGRLENGCFRLKPQCWVRGVPPLAWGVIANHSRLALGTADPLLLDTAHFGMGGVLAMFGGDQGKFYRVPFARRR